MCSPALLHAPWTLAQVVRLNANQRVASFHPYTCGGSEPHPPGAVLLATCLGWLCPYCAYRQTWCHAFSAEQDLASFASTSPFPALATMLVHPIAPAELLRLPTDHCPAQRGLGLTECGSVEGYFQFTYGSCQGALRVSEEAIELLAVFNEEPGNGDFACLIRHLVVLGQVRGRDLVALEVQSQELYEHLRLYWTMEPVPGTRHLLLPVGGPGSCRPELMSTGEDAQLDYLLVQLYKLLAYC